MDMLIEEQMKFPGIRFGEMRWYYEFIDDARIDARVRMRMLELGLVAANYGKILLITGISRTKEKNIEVYGSDQASGHRERPVRAVDFTVLNHDADFAARLRNHHAMYMDGGHFYTLMNHDVGAGPHWHLQVPYNPRINIKLYKG